jgi:hypothetical protein
MIAAQVSRKLVGFNGCCWRDADVGMARLQEERACRKSFGKLFKIGERSARLSLMNWITGWQSSNSEDIQRILHAGRFPPNERGELSHPHNSAARHGVDVGGYAACCGFD